MGSKRQPPVNWVHLPPTELGPDEELEPWELETVDEELEFLVGRQLAEQLDGRVAQYVSSGPPECACGHLLSSHRAGACYATAPRAGGSAMGSLAPPLDPVCGCREFRRAEVLRTLL